MGWRLTATIGGNEEAASANYPGIRIFRSESAHNPEPQSDVNAEWKVCNPESAGTCSAVTYYFAKKLHRELGIPVGLVLQPYAGTPIEGWMPNQQNTILLQPRNNWKGQSNSGKKANAEESPGSGHPAIGVINTQEIYSMA